MAAETLSSFQRSSDFVNKTRDYFCIDQPIGPLLWAGFSVVCFFLGFPASVLALKELYQRHQQNNTNDFFLFNMACIDFAYLSFLPFSVVNYMVWHNVEFEWFCNFMYSLTVSGRPLFMACVCGEYYFAVVHPIIYKTSKRIALIRKVMTVAVWLSVVCFGSLISSFPWSCLNVLESIPLLIALPVIGFCDISVLRALRKTDPSGKTNVHPQKKRALRTITNSFLMTFTVYLPPSIIFSLGQNTQLDFVTHYCILVFVAVCFTVSGSLISPVLYLESVGQLNIQEICGKK